ncbi:hypothetical protein, partial [uncultured Desulfovibrio sp.]|uniref:hypothetical protein n=1 Tax=uncultured Desulfovibrio sp. TaxID=167968 RepID=UPI002639114A
MSIVGLQGIAYQAGQRRAAPLRVSFFKGKTPMPAMPAVLLPARSFRLPACMECRLDVSSATYLEQFQFETLRVSNHTACR